MSLLKRLQQLNSSLDNISLVVCPEISFLCFYTTTLISIMRRQWIFGPHCDQKQISRKLRDFDYIFWVAGKFDTKLGDNYFESFFEGKKNFKSLLDKCLRIWGLGRIGDKREDQLV
ncbi:hypothetical protein PGT21_033026 [Puccinia graminis f. sp. tritici]|uniref:Uncharacterized protein n=1 Tax=Puccinia graminis f. sp. tritici TaxID=56615 RepID=A0A5B0P078_PUCGR|nr:hypothetical protein PGT21_033026 [Puccinia graminis f. sp. tritici]